MPLFSVVAKIASKVPALLGCVFAAILLYSGFQGLRGRNVVLVGRFWTNTITGSNARVAGAAFLFIGFLVGWFSLLAL